MNTEIELLKHQLEQQNKRLNKLIQFAIVVLLLCLSQFIVTANKPTASIMIQPNDKLKRESLKAGVFSRLKENMFPGLFTKTDN